MAKKRMFDKAIIDTDRFMDLSMSSKALYFLLGMEADDEGFVSYKKVMRVHGGNEDDVKVLEAKRFLIKFESGVVVITDWNKNNWLDSRRKNETEYQNEKKMLALTDNKEYVLSNGLAPARLEEKRREEKSIVKGEELPDWLNKEMWTQWLSYRKSRKLTCNQITLDKQILFLEKYKSQHKEMIEKSITNGWQGLFEPKGNAVKKVENVLPPKAENKSLEKLQSKIRK